MPFDLLGKLMSKGGLRNYIFEENQSYLDYYAMQTFNPADWEEIAESAAKYPGIFKFIIDSMKMSNEEKWETIENHLDNPKPPMGIMLGDVGSGKTGLAASIMDRMRKRRPIAGLFMTEQPKWVQEIDSPSEAEEGSLIFFDEAGILTSSRRSMSNTNQVMNDFLQIRRHKNMGMIIMTQHPRLPDITYTRLSTCFFVKPVPGIMIANKESDLTQTDLQNISVIESIIKLIPLKKEPTGWSKEFIFTDYESGFKAENDIPSWFGENQSKQYSDIGHLKAWKMSVDALARDADLKTVAKKLQIKGIKWSHIDVKHYGSMTEAKFLKEMKRNRWK